MSYDTQDSVALLNWDGSPAKIIQDAEWVLDERDDSTNRLRVPTTLAEVDGVESEQELIFKNRRFIIAEIDRDRDAGQAVLVADEAQVELGGIILTDFAFNSWTAFQGLEWALKDTRWTPGEVQNVRFGRANFDDLTVLEACHFLANHQDAVLSFDSLRRRVNLTATRGTVREEVFTYGRQLTNIEKSERQPKLTTLYPTGADDMTVARVNNGSEVVEDYGYYTSRGISLANARRWYKKEEYWEDSRYEVAENMLRDAQKRLADEAYPQITYTLTAQATTSVDGTDDFDLTDIGLGDRVYVWDQEIDTKLVAEVTAVTTSSDASANELVLSTLPESFGGSGSRGGGYYFGDSGSTAGNPLFPRSGFQPRPSMPILEELSQLGVAEVRWNGQDHDGNYDTIPVRFGSVIPRVARLGVDGSIPSPDSDDAFEGTVIHERGGGTATVAFGAAGQYAVWFYMLGQDQRTTSQYSEPLVVEVKPFVDVEQMERDLAAARDELEQATIAYEAGQEDLSDRLDYLNQTRIPELQQAIQNARDAADQSFAALDDRIVSAETDLATAKTDIATARAILDPLPGELQAAKTDAQAAQAAAEAAQAGVQEALQNVSNYLPNGGFELGLDHWSTTGTVTLNANSNTGDNAAFIQVSSSLTSTTVIPVDVGQVWEVGFYSRASSGVMTVAAMLADTDGHPVSVIEQMSVPAYGSYRFYSFRVTVPSGVPFMVLQFSTTSASANRLVDDVSLKNVTDVVRLERAAAEATAKAQEALDKYEDMQFFVNGVADDLSDAKDLLATKADTSRLNELDGKLAELGTHFTKVWRQATPPPAGTTYEWTDGAHMSASVRKENGVEVARNLIANPSFEEGVSGFTKGSGISNITNSTNLSRTYSGVRNASVYITDSSTGGGWVGLPLEGAVSAGDYVAFSASLRRSSGPTHFRYYAVWSGAGGEFFSPTSHVILSGVMTDLPRVSEALQVPEGASGGTIWVRVYSDSTGAPADGLFNTDAWHAAKAASEQASLAQVETYFDGDSPDDRANDLWYDADGVPHFWLKGWGWAVLDDERLAELQNQVSAHEQRLADAEQNIAAKVDASRVDEIEGQVDTALTGPITHDRLRAGSGAFDEAFVDELWAKNIRALSAELARVVVSSQNLWPDPDFTGDYSADPRTSRHSDGLLRVTSNDGNGLQGNYWTDQLIPVSEGNEYSVAARFTRMTGTNGYTELWARLYNASGSYISGQAHSLDSSGGSGTLSGTVAAVSGAAYMSIGILFRDKPAGQSVRVDSVRVTSMLDGSMVIENTLDVRHLNVTGDMAAAIISADTARVAELIAGDIFANEGFFNRIDSREGWIGEVALENGAVTAEKMTITGDMAAALVEADKGRFINLLAEDLIADNATLITAAIENLDVTEQSNFADAFAAKLQADEFTARVATLSRAVVAAQNLWPDPEFTGGGYSPWATRHDGLLGINGLGDGLQGSYWTHMPIPVTPGNEYKITVSTSFTVGNAGQYRVYARSYDADMNYINNGTSTQGTYSSGGTRTTTWTPYTDDTAYLVIGIYTIDMPPNIHVRLNSLRVENSVDGTLIATNSIKTPQLDVDQIFGDTAVLNKLFADLITARLLNAQEAMIGGVLIKNQAITVNHLTGLDSILTELLRAKKIEAGDIDANAINGMTITGGVVSGGRVEGAIVEGGTVRVGPRFTGGSGNAGIELASNGVIRRWDTAGNLDMVLDGNNNRITGRVSTARPGSPGVIIEPSTTAGNPGIFFASGGSASGNNSGVVHDNDWNMVIRGRRTSPTAARQRTKVEGGFHITSGRLTSDVEATFTDGIQVSSRISNFYADVVHHGRLRYSGFPTTDYSANVHLAPVTGGTSQVFYKTSSVRKIKVNIETVGDDVAERILNLDPRDWLSRAYLEDGVEGVKHLIHDHNEPGIGPTIDEDALADKLGYVPRRSSGLVAEELVEAGLGQFATYDIADDGTEVLSGVAYDRLWILFIPIVRKLRDRVNALEETVESQAARINDLESRLAALEARL